MARANEGHSFACRAPTHFFASGMNRTRLSPQTQSVTALGPVLILLPIEGRRLSWPEWMVTNRGGLPARRRSPISVLTGPGVE